MRDHEKIMTYLKDDEKNIDIPKSLEPEQMQKRLKQYKAQKTAEKKKRRVRFWKSISTVAACLCVVAGITLTSKQPWKDQDETTCKDTVLENISKDIEITEVADAGLEFPCITYEDIYASMKKTWEEEKKWRAYDENSIVMLDAPEEEAMKEMSNTPMDAVGTTNVQTVGVDEGDIVKNDGRYLYQKIRSEDHGEFKTVIQVVDTLNGLKEVARIGEFESLEEFYVCENIVVTIESKYLADSISDEKGRTACKDIAYWENYFHEISFFDISDRTKPDKINTFTLQGNYASSRIVDGYFYGFSRYYANEGKGSEDYDAYVPKINGIPLKAEDIYLPEENDDTSYLVLVAVDLKNPMEFTDTTGIVAGSDIYYVSENNIYVADYKTVDLENGWNSDSTELLRFSYDKGNFSLQATGKINGSLNNNFSLDEYEDYLRVVSTVREYETVEITDDRTGENIGAYIENERQTNALYVLNDGLEVIGKIEGLAENEQIYSARFMGTIGYFVTFRQTDPLFAVDLSVPESPQILSELKVSGFSEYLHGYGKDRLFGLGMEADEETGIQEGMKLSMFDVSDPTNVQEISRLPLEKYNHSEALYNHHAIMISPTKNLIGFEAEGSNYGDYWKEYLVYTYEEDRFVQKLVINAKTEGGSYYISRGTFIGNVFYLLRGDGSIQSYDLTTGEFLESLKP